MRMPPPRRSRQAFKRLTRTPSPSPSPPPRAAVIIIRTCHAAVCDRCITSLGAAVCYNTAVLQLQAAAAKNRSADASGGGDHSGHQLEIILPTVILGERLLRVQHQRVLQKAWMRQMCIAPSFAQMSTNVL